MWSQMRKAYGDDHYMYRFQAPGEIEAELGAVELKTLMKIFLTGRNPGPFDFPKAHNVFLHVATTAPPIVVPSWLSQQDIDYYASKFERTGFTGGINYYRALPLTWNHTAAWRGGKVIVQTKIVLGDLDLNVSCPWCEGVLT